MAAYAYAIKIDRKYQTIRFQETHEVKDDVLSIAQLRELNVGDEDAFWVREDEGFNPITTLVVEKVRKETKAERLARVSRGIRYMREYKKRKSERKSGLGA